MEKDSLQIKGGDMIEYGEVRPEGCICEPCSDIAPIWRDIRTKFGYTTLGENGQMEVNEDE